MNRRDFFKLAGLAGAAVVAPRLLVGSRRAHAAEPYRGTFFVTVHAGGGWDPTSICDPKGRANEEAEDPVNNYFTGDIGTAGNIKYAPVAENQAFFDKHYQNLLVINGVDTQTNNHDSGRRHTWCGQLPEGYPSFTALVAAAAGADRPMAFITNGGYDYTGGKVAATRVGNTGVFQRLAYPNRPDVNNEERGYHTTATAARIRAAQRARLEAQQQAQHLPHVQNSMSALYTSRTSDNELKLLTEYLPDELDNSNNQLKRQAQLAVASYKAGLTVSANLAEGGFDTHGNHDDNAYPRIQRLLEGVDFLWQEAERQGVADNMVVMIGSDFGRTPYYNANNGKDHWSITSVMLMGKGIPGNRVIGATTDGFRAKTVNSSTLALDDNGLRIEPKHIHRALRKLAGVDGSDVANEFFVPGDDLPLFS